MKNSKSKIDLEVAVNDAEKLISGLGERIDGLKEENKKLQEEKQAVEKALVEARYNALQYTTRIATAVGLLLIAFNRYFGGNVPEEFKAIVGTQLGFTSVRDNPVGYEVNEENGGWNVNAKVKNQETPA